MKRKGMWKTAALAVGLVLLAACSGEKIEVGKKVTDDAKAGDVAGLDTVTGEGTVSDTAGDGTVTLPDGAVDAACQDVGCLPTCTKDADCPEGAICVTTAGGCCSECQKKPCETDQDCPKCTGCEKSGGHCLPYPCPSDCETDAECEDGFECITNENGCCGFCQEKDPCAIASCSKLCQDDEECQDDEVCLVYMGGCCSECMPLLVELEPLCVHAPKVVPAGAKFPVAFYGRTGCATFDHAEVESDGKKYKVRLFGKLTEDGKCPEAEACGEEGWIYTGLVWLDAPNPGAYLVQVGPEAILSVGASGGVIDEPACQPGCAAPELTDVDWTLRFIYSGDPLGTCMAPPSEMYLDLPLDVEGSCQSYTIGGVLEMPDMKATHCTDSYIFFGDKAPYWVDASLCSTDPEIPFAPYVILGIIQEAFGSPLPAQLFLVEGTPLWN